MQKGPPLEVKVWGDFACFTRPEMKAERVSYSVMTPSSARGVLEAIFWKPEFSWQVREIHVLNRIRHFSILRNEVNDKAVVSTAMGWVEKDGGYFADDEKNRAQRHTLALRDVAYIIKADVVLKRHATEPDAKYRDQFRRHVSKGKCHHTPYLGCREFTAFFGEPDGSEKPIDLSDDLGLMLFDQIIMEEIGGNILYKKHGANGGKVVIGKAAPKFFSARLDNGVLKVPPELYQRRASDAFAEIK